MLTFKFLFCTTMKFFHILMLASVNCRYILIHISKISHEKFKSNSGPHVISSNPPDEAGDDYQYTDGNTQNGDSEGYDKYFGIIS